MRKTIKIETEALGMLHAHRLMPWQAARHHNAMSQASLRATGGNVESFAVLLDLFSELYPEYVAFIADSTKRTSEEIGSLDPSEAIEVLAAVLKVNKMSL